MRWRPALCGARDSVPFLNVVEHSAILSNEASDLYLLGSMAHFFVTGIMITPTVVSHLNLVHRPRSEGGGWTGTFAGVLPYWREAFAVVLEEFENALPTNDAAELTPSAQAFMVSVTQLCEPDPVNRGHPLERLGHRDLLSVERYISLFNRLRSESLVVQ